MSVVLREDGAKIWWDSHGEGPPVLLIMGFAYPAEMWFRLLPGLSEHYRVLRIDNRGAGRTGDVVGAPYTVEMMADDCLAVLDAAGEQAAHVVGLSMGGLMAQELGLSSPERVRSLILMATHPGIAHAVLDPDAIALLQSRGAMTPEQAAEASIPFNYAPTTSRSDIEQDWARRFPLSTSAQGYAAQGGTAFWSGLDRLATMTVPTLVLQGELDRLVPAANTETIARLVPGATLVTIPNANHVLTTDQPERVLAELLAFLDGQPA